MITTATASAPDPVVAFLIIALLLMAWADQ